ncbi:MAG: glutaredoxin 3 [Steroidobacteraceae bacterium]|nr:glutaredoxin 3 [Steroidobacteraceae bacterium]MDW8259912.1 glutaredoxin 3 [Gammaproteobacteria bacterium]
MSASAPARVSTPRVIVYATAWCPYCERARQLLRAKGVAFTEIDVDADPERRAEMERLSGRRTVPQIFIGATHVGGCDDLYELNQRGGLDPLLESVRHGNGSAA